MDTVRVEGFGANLRGRKIWLVGDEHVVPNRLHVLEQELMGRGRKVLVLADGRKHLPRWSNSFEWDAIFKVKDALDLRLALTYILNAAKPLRIVWLGEEPAQVLMSKFHGADISFIGFGSHHPQQAWDAIFFSGMIDAHRINEVLISKMGSAKLSHFNLPNVIPELKAARAGLVWSSIEESEKAGHLYWYDIAEGEPPTESFDMTEAASFLRELADRICSAK